MLSGKRLGGFCFLLINSADTAHDAGEHIPKDIRMGFVVHALRDQRRPVLEGIVVFSCCDVFRKTLMHVIGVME